MNFQPGRLTDLPLPQADTQPLHHVLAVLKLTRTGPASFQGSSLPAPHGRVYGGQVMAQCLQAAGATVPAGREPHSMHLYFLRFGELDIPLEFEVEVLHDGRSFSARRVTASQGGTPIMTMSSSFQLQQDGLEHFTKMPPAPAPHTLPSNATLFSKVKHPAAWMLLQTGVFDIRHVEPGIYFEPDAAGGNTQAIWLRARTGLADATAQLVHRALLAYVCDHVMLEPALRQHDLFWSRPGMSIASLDHAMWWHRDVDVREWLLLVQESPTAQGGRALGCAKVYEQGGELVATAVQEGMLRVR